VTRSQSLALFFIFCIVKHDYHKFTNKVLRSHIGPSVLSCVMVHPKNKCDSV
jgi:hypothetical protein